MKTNYHTHTARCQHAEGEDEAYVLAALEAGFTALGFSDHAPWPFAGGYVSPIRMRMDQLDGYIASVHGLRDKYAGRIPVSLGLESEYFPRYRDHLLRMREKGIDYYLLGQHYADSEEDHPYVGSECRTDDGVRRYADTLVAGIRTGLYACVAHPDLFMRHRTEEQFSAACEQAADEICQAAGEAGIPIEYNLLGLRCQLDGNARGYPSARFWRYARRYDNAVILGVDAHSPDHLRDAAAWTEGKKQVLAMGYRLTEQIKEA